MPTLGKPQLPPPEPLIPPKGWTDVKTNFEKTQRHNRSITRYLQTYLYNTFSQIIPATYIVNTVAHSQSPYSIGQVAAFFAASAGASADTILNLPQATGSGRVIVVYKVDANAHNIAITPKGSDTINGSNSALNLGSQYDVRRLIDYGSGTWALW